MDATRQLSLSRVRDIALAHGLPHAGLTLEHELDGMLSFFHSLNAVLWYDAPGLRELVILDPQWVIDAATCFIRDFELIDHAAGYARMAALDQRAIREEPDAWSLLTAGKATLQRKLLDILWSAGEFAPHKAALLDLLTRFGLAIPLNARPNEFLVPALLPPTATATARPHGWPAVPADAARIEEIGDAALASRRAGRQRWHSVSSIASRRSSLVIGIV